MKKFIAVFFLSCTCLFAEQFSGLLINETTGQALQPAGFSINGQSVQVDAQGQYQAELSAAELNYYLVQLQNGPNYLCVTKRNRLNLQVPGQVRERAKRSKLTAEVNLRVLEAGQIVPRADVFIYSVFEDIHKNIALLREVRDYNQGRAEYKFIQPTPVMYTVISRNNDLYIQELTGLVPGKIQEVSVELTQFVKAKPLVGVAYRARTGALEILSLPTANNYYVAENILPVHSKTLEDYKLFAIGPAPEFPADLNYYNLREFVYKTNNGIMHVYTDLNLTTIDMSRYGAFQLLWFKGYHFAELDFSNFTPSLVKDSRAFLVWQPEQEQHKESNDNELN